MSRSTKSITCFSNDKSTPVAAMVKTNRPAVRPADRCDQNRILRIISCDGFNCIGLTLKSPEITRLALTYARRSVAIVWKQMRVLLVDDDREVAEYVRREL